MSQSEAAYAESAKRHGDQAEECRAKADLMSDQQTRAQYHRMAEAYDAIAESEERLAGRSDTP